MSYYNLEQTLEIFRKKLPETLLPFDLPQLADLCRRGEVTPVFSYDKYINEGLANERELPTYIKELTRDFNGYLTLPALTNLLFQLTETVVTSTAYIYEEIGKENKGIFVSLEDYGYDRFEDFAGHDSYCDGDTNCISVKNLLFPIEQVKRYISKCSNDNELDNSSPPATTGGFGNLGVKYGKPKTDKEHVIELEKKLEKLNLEFKELQQQNTELQRNNTQIKNQDSRLVVYLAFILSQKLSKYRKNNGSINAKQIGEAITTTAQELGLSKDDMHGFKRPDARIRTLIDENKELLINFGKAIKPNADVKK